MDQDAPGLRPSRPVKRWGAEAVEAACGRALEAEAVNVGLIGRTLERGSTADDTPPAPAPAGPARFARDAAHFSTVKSKRGNDSSPTGADETAGGVA